MNPVDRPFRRLLSKVPEVTIFFWILAVLSAAVGETLADVFTGTLTLAAGVAVVLLAVALVVQFQIRRYVPGVYWAVVLLAGIVSTLIADDVMVDWDVTPAAVAIAAGVAMGATLAAWAATEKTLSIHTVDTPRREAFYWLTVVLAFALGAATGNLTTLGYGASAALFAVPVAVVALSRRLGLNAVTAFWAAFVLTGPFGASLGGLLSQPALLGAPATSVALLLAIATVVAYLTRSAVDRPSLGLSRPLRSRAW